MDDENLKLREFHKSQGVRLMDVFILAPFLIYLGVKPNNLTFLDRSFLILIGSLTAIYNYKNYKRSQEA